MKRGAKKNGAPKNAGRPGAGSVRVAAYCRVSTDLDGQRTSLEAQEEAFRAQIAARRSGNWSASIQTTAFPAPGRRTGRLSKDDPRL